MDPSGIFETPTCSAKWFHSFRHPPGIYTGFGGDFESDGGKFGIGGAGDSGMAFMTMGIL